VRGAAHTAPADAVAAAGLNRHRFMVDVDPGSTARRVDRLPWTGSTTVSRHWPGTVVLTLHERTAVAALGAGPGPFSLVDATGRVLQTVPQPPPGVVSVAGAEAPPAPGQLAGPAARAAVAVASAIPADLRGRVSGVSLIAGGEVELRLSRPSGLLVRFGSADDVPAKMVALSTLVAKANLAGATVIDVRVPTAPVLTRGGPSR
jgi:cell division protein FtsQ